MDSEIIINSVTDEIISRIDSSWDKLQKIRFVYLSLGSYLEKNTDFFLNDKLADLALSKNVINSIYFNNRLNVTNKIDGTLVYQITCKSAAAFLKNAFEKLGIEHSLVHTKGNLNGILHWFVVAKDDNGNQYFLTLAADLPYIKNELPTRHFANNISYFDLNGNEVYVLPDNPNIDTEEVSYTSSSGETIFKDEIKHICLYPDYQDFLKEIDESIGFSKLYQDEDLLNNKDFQELFYYYINDSSMTYQILRASFNMEEDYSKNIDEITLEEIENYKKSMTEFLSSYLIKKGYSNSPETAIYDALKILLENVDIINFDGSLSSKELAKKYKKDLRKLKNTDYNDALGFIQTIYTIFDKLDDFYNTKIDLQKPNIDSKEKEELEKKLLECKKSISIIKLKPLLDKIAYIELKEKLTVKTHEYLPLSYIVTKFNLVFPAVFDCNFKDYKTVRVSPFSIQNYSEQIVIIKEFMKKIFSELSEQNCMDIDEYNKRYTPVENRIRTFPLKNRETGEYCIGFDFGGKDEENTVNYIFIPSENTLRKRDPIKDSEKYWIVSERFNKALQRLEDIEEKENPRIVLN